MKILFCCYYWYRQLFMDMRHLYKHILWYGEIKGEPWCTLCNEKFANANDAFWERYKK